MGLLQTVNRQRCNSLNHNTNTWFTQTEEKQIVDVFEVKRSCNRLIFNELGYLLGIHDNSIQNAGKSQQREAVVKCRTGKFTETDDNILTETIIRNYKHVILKNEK